MENFVDNSGLNELPDSLLEREFSILKGKLKYVIIVIPSDIHMKVRVIPG